MCEIYYRHSFVFCGSDKKIESVTASDSFTGVVNSNRDKLSSDFILLPLKGPPASRQNFGSRNSTGASYLAMKNSMDSPATNTDSPMSFFPSAKRATTKKNGNKITKANAMQEVRKIAKLEKGEDKRRLTAAINSKKRGAGTSCIFGPPQPYLSKPRIEEYRDQDHVDDFHRTSMPMASFDLYDRTLVNSSPNSHHSYSSLSGTEDDRSCVSNLTGKDSSLTMQEMLLPAQSLLKKTLFFSDSPVDQCGAPTKKRLCQHAPANQPHAPCEHTHSSFPQLPNYQWQDMTAGAPVACDRGTLNTTVPEQAVAVAAPQLFLEPVNLLHTDLVNESMSEHVSSDDDDYRWMSSFLEAEISTRI
jgi:hypothetical protein